jgi:hypothetical protein
MGMADNVPQARQVDTKINAVKIFMPQADLYLGKLMDFIVQGLSV